MLKQTGVWLSLALAVCLLALGSACSKADGPKTEEPTTAEKTYNGPRGTVTGVVSFNGTPPAPKKIDASADPVCGRENPNLATEDTVVTNGKLANVFVYIKEGNAADGTKFADYTWSTPTTAATLDQRGCRYIPHVMGVQTNQKVSITNSDPTQHNVHPTPKVNPEWNQTQANGAPPIERSFARSEVLIPVKCNQHPWMKAYVGVMRHPFFAVSAEDGTFTLKDVPAGTYTVVAWKEGGADGTQKTMSVTVPASGTVSADFAFGEGSAAGPNTLKVLPAIEFPMLRRH